MRAHLLFLFLSLFVASCTKDAPKTISPHIRNPIVNQTLPPTEDKVYLYNGLGYSKGDLGTDSLSYTANNKKYVVHKNGDVTFYHMIPGDICHGYLNGHNVDTVQFKKDSLGNYTFDAKNEIWGFPNQWTLNLSGDSISYQLFYVYGCVGYDQDYHINFSGQIIK